MKRPHLLFVMFFVTMFTAIYISAADIYKWVDSDGNTHYGDTPPTGATLEQVRVNSSSSGGSSVRPEESGNPGQIESR